MDHSRFRKFIIHFMFLIGMICAGMIRGTAQSTILDKAPVSNTYFTDLLNEFQIKQSILQVNKEPVKQYSIMLPSPGQEHDSPLFCRLEDKINEGNKIQCLFRLGSVSYVNYLEQKGDHQRLMLQQLR